MNDQQSSSVPDPHTQRSSSTSKSESQPTPVVEPSEPSGSNGTSVSGLSDQEAFSMLAMSMSGDDNSEGAQGTDNEQIAATSAGSPVEQSAGSAEDNGWEATELDAVVDDLSAPSAIEDSAKNPEAVIDLRFKSPLLSALAGRLQGRRNLYDWSTPALVGDQWEVCDGADSDSDDSVYGRVTEIVDLSTVTAPPKNGVDNVLQQGNDSGANGVGLTNVSRRRLLPVSDADDTTFDLPPLVFLDTRDDIVPHKNPEFEADPRSEMPVESRSGADSTTPTGPEGAGSVEADGDDAAPDSEAATMLSADVDAGAASEIGSERPDSRNSPDSMEPNSGDHVDFRHVGHGAAAFEEGHLDRQPEIVSLGNGQGETGAGPEPLVNVPMSVWESTDTDQVIEDAGRMFDQYSGPVIAVIASVTDDRRSIDEALHETFLTAWESMDSFDPDEPRGPWMFTLARRTAFEQAARTQHENTVTSGYPEPSHREDNVPVDKSWEAWEVRLAVDQLSALEYDVLRLTHQAGRIHPEIASETRSTVGAVKSRAYSGSHRLVELLDHVIRPEAENVLTDDQASALTWYLAGVADGSDLDERERSAVRRVRTQLSSTTAWIAPDLKAKDRLVAVVSEAIELSRSGSGDGLSITRAFTPTRGANEAGRRPTGEVDPSSRAAVTGGLPTGDSAPGSQSNATGARRFGSESDQDGRPPYTSILIGLGLVLIALMVLTNVFGLLSSDDATLRTYQMQSTEIDPDASAVLHLSRTETGTRFEFEFGGLDPSATGHYYAAWLQRTTDGGVAPLGSFVWEVSGDVVTLSGPLEFEDYDVIVITDSTAGTEASVADPNVLVAAVD